ncbi:MAG: alpha/beta hydrolase family protein [Planctomycetota bacterium]|jgi:dienelactone hydrolase
MILKISAKSVMQRAGVFVLLLAGCSEQEPETRPTSAGPAAAGIEVAQETYREARRRFQTNLVERGPSPQDWEPLRLPPNAVEVKYRSDGLELVAFADRAATSGEPKPGVVFLHGGFAYGDEDWDMPQPFRDAGFVVMIPVLRGENGQDGTFTLYVDEVDDVVAAAAAFADMPGVDARRIFVAGHSAGGTLAVLAAMASDRFVAAASLSGLMDQSIHVQDDAWLIRFDPSNAEELRIRSPAAYAASIQVPTRLYYGSMEWWARDSTERTARLATEAGGDVKSEVVPGDHFSSVPPAMAKAIPFFKRLLSGGPATD